jgi:hypothetical protein
VVLGLGFAIIYPDDLANRRARVRRVLVSLGAFGVTFALVDAVVSAILGTLGPLALVTIPLGALIPTAFSVVPICIAERVAGLFRPRRTPGWAAIAVAVGVGWGALLARISTLPHLSHWVSDAYFLLPGLAAGIAWFVMVEPSERRVDEIFE